MTITPDIKDWTWVLERPCPECGIDPSKLALAETGTLLRRIVAAWQDVLGGWGDVTARPSPDRWSPLEYGCHVRDCFLVYHERLRRMLTEDHPTYANWDQDATAREQDYASQDPRVVRRELVTAGEPLARSFDAVTGDQWHRTGSRSDGATFDVASFTRYFLHDPLHHLWDVGRPLALQPLSRRRGAPDTGR